MTKKSISIMTLLLIAGLVLGACQPAASTFTPRSDALGTVTIPPGDPIHIGLH